MPRRRSLRRSDGAVVGMMGHDGRQAGQFHAIHQIASDSFGNLYTGEVEDGKRIQKFALVKFVCQLPSKRPCAAEIPGKNTMPQTTSIWTTFRISLLSLGHRSTREFPIWTPSSRNPNAPSSPSTQEIRAQSGPRRDYGSSDGSPSRPSDAPRLLPRNRFLRHDAPAFLLGLRIL